MDVIKTQEISSRTIEKVMVHPLVLLSVVDHYNRVDKDLLVMDTRKRVVGVLPHVVGWYCTGPKLWENDLDDTTQKSDKVFVHVLSEITAHEVEEIGVEHLLRDVKDTTISSLATEDVFNLLPNLNVTELIKSFSVKTSDMMLVIYLTSLIRSVISPHKLINNKKNEKTEDSKPVSVPAAVGI
ncbi:hypothetical protein UlMin_025088 [Ulmus minor]